MMRAAGKVTALIGTIEYHLAGQSVAGGKHDAGIVGPVPDVHELEEMAGTHVTLEASSHALDLGRIFAMDFHTAGIHKFHARSSGLSPDDGGIFRRQARAVSSRGADLPRVSPC